MNTVDFAIYEDRCRTGDQEAEDLINIGAYTQGSNPRIDLAIQKIDAFNRFLQQPIKESVSLEDSVSALREIMEDSS